MILTIDNLAAKYHLLPSGVMNNATTFDLFVLDVASKWEKHQISIQNGTAATPKYSQAELQAILNRNKGND